MAHSEGHSSTEKTILWIILPATIAVSLYFTAQSHGHDFKRTHLGGDLGDLTKKEMPAPAKIEDHAADTIHHDTTHVHAPEAPGKEIVNEHKMEVKQAH